MTPTIRSLIVLSGCYLATACTEPAGKAAVDKPSALAAPKPGDVPPALAAVSPARPESVADAPRVAEPPKASPSLSLGTPEPEPVVIEHEEYDRPLDPKEVQVDRFVLAHAVEGREPVDESDVFSTDTKEIFAFVQVANAKGLPYAFKVHFEPLDGPATPYGVQLTVPTAARFRTWSWTRIQRTPGRYKAVLRTLEGKDIAQREFEIEPATDDEADKAEIGVGVDVE